MKISVAGLELIRSFEGYHRKLPNGDCTTYRCPAGVLTIGFGNTEGIKEGMVWTRAEAEAALLRELAQFEAAVDRLVTVELNQNQFDALVSFSYNCGIGALQKSTLLKKLNTGDYKGAASQFKQWNKGGGRVLPGLVDRRAREATLFMTPVAEAEDPGMAQSVGASARKMTTTEKVTLGGAVGTVIVKTAEYIIGPPEVVTTVVTNVGAWQSIVMTSQSLLTWGAANPHLVAAGGTAAGLWALHSWRTSK
jgi:lysozyme